MRAFVTLYSTTDTRHNNVFTLEVSAAKRAVAAIPALLERHLQREHHDCPIDAWAVHTVHAVSNLPRIHARGVIRDGTAILPATADVRVVDRHLSTNPAAS